MTDSGLMAVPTLTRPALPSLGVIRRTVREIGLAMIVGGVVVLLFVGYQLFGTSLAEQHAQTALGHAFKSAQLHGGAAAVTPVAPSVKSAGSDAPTLGASPTAAVNLSPSTPQGSAIEHIVIPAIGLDSYVVQGTAEADLMKGPGHYIGTPFPGQNGNAVIAGHRTTYGAPFFRLNELSIGDRISVTNTKGRTFVYAMIRRLIAAPTGPSATAVLANTRTAELSLTTCNPRFEATNRLVVVATLIGRPAAAALASPTILPALPSSPAVTTTRPATAAAPARATLGAGNTEGWPPGIAYGAGTIALWVATRVAVNRTRRWRRAGAFALGIAACAVPLWFCFENVIRLLPQSI
jgi:sortase A